MSKPRVYDDVELMQYADGEIGTAAIAAAIEERLTDPENADARTKVAALEQMSDGVRSYLELAGDDAEPRLDAMWETIERRIQANGASRKSAAEAERLFSDPEAPARARRESVWTRLLRWFDDHRGHFVTGAVTAGAVAAIFLLLREEPKAPVVAETAPRSITPVQATTVSAVPPRVESLNVTEGSSAVFMLEGSDGDDASAAVIFVTFDEEDVEGPI